MLETTIKAAKESGNLLIQNIGKFKYAKFKRKNDLVTTDLDVKSEEKIVSIIKKKYPDHKFITEEIARDKISSGYNWIIDPISATKNYIHGLPHFAVAIGLMKNGQIILNVVYDPFYNELFWAKKGGGAYLNNKKVKVSQVKNFKDALVGFGWNKTGDRKNKEGVKLFSKLALKKINIRMIGSMALKNCYVACGRLDACIKTAKDIFADVGSKLIVEEAGGKFTDFENKEWNVKSKNAIISNKILHNQIYKFLKNK